MTDLLTQLAAPFDPKHITWKPGKAASDGKTCMAMAYGDLRAYQARLDEVCGTDWTVEYEPWGDTRIIARLTINGVTRASTGEMSTQDVKNEMGGTVAEAQAFKRAAAAFGLGRYLYDLPNQWAEFDAQRKRFTEAGLAKLENSYKAWYAVNSKPAVEVKPAPVAPRETPTTKAGKAQTPQQQLWGAGLEVFGDDWDLARGWLIAGWTARNTPANTRNSSSDLTDAERVQIADYITGKATELVEPWRKQKLNMAKATA